MGGHWKGSNRERYLEVDEILKSTLVGGGERTKKRGANPKGNRFRGREDPVGGVGLVVNAIDQYRKHVTTDTEH